MSRWRTCPSYTVIAAVAALIAVPSAQALEWRTTELGPGIKPALALDSAGAAHVAIIDECFTCAVTYATNKSGEWVTETVSSGYFYGPVDIDIGPDDVPVIAYHDHQASQFSQNLGAGVVNIRGADGWTTISIDNPGHDQWDADVFSAGGGIWGLAGVDPAQFGRTPGLEYVTNAFGDVRVEQVFGPMPYEFGVSVEEAGTGVVGISFYGTHDARAESPNPDAPLRDLIYAERSPGPGGAWTLTTVDAAGDVGRYSDLAFDADGNPYISYFQFDSRSSGVVRYARRGSDGAWTTETVGRLESVMPGFAGARKITNIALGPDGAPRIMYGDRSEVVYATRGADGQWTREVALKAGARPFGQLVEFALDGAGNPHFVTFEITNLGPPNKGVVVYGVGR